jgi:hypothetical protein
MISLFITVFIFLLLAVIVEVATTALRLTGMDIHTARFQALSALSGTGFTTNESELIAKDKQRRVIVMTLMIIGPIGFLTILTSILLSSRENIMLYQLLALAILAFLVLRISRSRRIMAVFHKMIEHSLKRRHYPRKVALEEVLQLNDKFGVCEIKISKHSIFCEKTLAESSIKEKGFIVLAIKRKGELLAVPHANDKIAEEDILVIFGNLSGIREFTK